jgi:glycerate-2-kinase
MFAIVKKTPGRTIGRRSKRLSIKRTKSDILEKVKAQFFNSQISSSKAIQIFQAALHEVDAAHLIRTNVRRRGEWLFIRDKKFCLDAFENIYLIALGKASPYMTKPLIRILGWRLSKGIVVCRPGEEISGKKIACLPAVHPLPDERSVRAAEEILSLANTATRKDLVFVLISGGGSAQVCLPRAPATLADKIWVTDELLRSGAKITELNTVRKQLSSIKGGRLAEAAYPAAVINLVISDVIHDDLENIASGPTYWDSSTPADAQQVLKKYDLWRRAPHSVRKAIRNGLRGQTAGLRPRDHRVFRKVSTFIVGNSRAALKAGAGRAKALRLNPVILTTADSGEARVAAREYVSLIAEIVRVKKARRRPLCLLAGGELTVTVRGAGKGGRNTEFVLAVLVEAMKVPHLWKPGAGSCERRDFLVASLGTDGLDGNTEAAGAWVTAATIDRAAKHGLDPEKYLRNNDSYGFFKKVGGLIITGPTRTNVMDLRLFLL